MIFLRESEVDKRKSSLSCSGRLSGQILLPAPLFNFWMYEAPLWVLIVYLERSGSRILLVTVKLCIILALKKICDDRVEVTLILESSNLLECFRRARTSAIVVLLLCHLVNHQARRLKIF